MVVKATERERKFRASSFKAKKIAVRALEQERVQNCTNSVSFLFLFIFLILFLFCFVLVMLFSCFGLSENVGMMRLSLPGGL